MILRKVGRYIVLFFKYLYDLIQEYDGDIIKTERKV